MTNRITKQFLTLTCIVFLAIGSIIGIMRYAHHQLSYNGPIVSALSQFDRLSSDIRYAELLVERSYRQGNQLLDRGLIGDGAARNTLNLRDFAASKQNFDQIMQNWQRGELPQTLKLEFERKLKVTSDQFWDILSNALLPALNGSDLQRAQAHMQALDDAHAELVYMFDQFLQMAQLTQAGRAAEASQQEYTLNSAILLASLIALGVIGLILYLTRIKIGDPLSLLNKYLANLSKGDLKQAIPNAERADEFGAIAAHLAALNHFMITQQDVIQRGYEERDLQSQASADATRQEQREADDREQAIRQLKKGLIALANGDLKFRINDEFSDEFEELRIAYNSSIDVLADILIEFLSTTGSVKGSMQDVSRSFDQLSGRTERQATSLEQTVTALEQITGTVQSSTEQASQVSTMVSDAKDGAEQSGKVVRNAIEAMTKIEDSASQISKIVSVIDEIAFQTNLLALNAGVEAARAGEAGKGFAVVAQEVRDLAGRSAKAAKEIKTLIDTSSGHVETGVSLVNETGSALLAIEEQVSAINDIIDRIVRSSEEQSTALAQINGAVGDMDQVTQKNAEMVQETALTSDSLLNLTNHLEDLIGQFDFGRRKFVQSNATNNPIITKNYEHGPAANSQQDRLGYRNGDTVDASQPKMPQIGDERTLVTANSHNAQDKADRKTNTSTFSNREHPIANDRIEARKGPTQQVSARSLGAKLAGGRNLSDTGSKAQESAVGWDEF